MQLEFKPDWEETKDRYRAFWAHEYFGRCALAVTAPLDAAPDGPPPARPATPHARWTDLDYAAACNDYHMRRTFYGGEAFPIWRQAFAHVPALCELPRLQAIQILPGAGKPSPLHYLETLKYVQRAGKNLQVWLPPDEVETALRKLSARGLFISTWCRTEREARDLLLNAERWSVDRG